MAASRRSGLNLNLELAQVYTLPNYIQDDTYKSALHEAVLNGDDKQLQILVNQNMSRTTKTANGNTPLHEAALRGYSRSVRILCAIPVDKSKTKCKKSSNKEANESIVINLLSVQNDKGCTALHLAAQNGHNQCCRELLMAGIDPDIQNLYGDTALHTACRYGHAGATRIILSSNCNPNIPNLNGDLPLHISCAMEKRKLTRLLLEVNCNVDVTNAQDETPRDISIRKNNGEILDILSNCQKVSHKTGIVKEVNWSPYGCHYFPDLQSFPSPKLETLPKEPLKKGEQYYLDLAGRIRKGPQSTRSTCYCGPFFKHIENEISCNRKVLRKLIVKNKKKLEHKVQELATQTNDQVEKLTRSMITDRIRCENRRILLENWQMGKDDSILIAKHHNNCNLISKFTNNNRSSLSRCRSLDLLPEHISSISSTSAQIISKSCNELDDETK
ncbi:serine/threonine-protein phosphatase 6 regulatory ankyrin repeat subunit C [Teleopsis dalmanni]|uniref:serine/threonine-protein phosphatase 6 regulatory ankyrin repeat subunit C n=1 Tax=Teleopsis dalmanni TaxID=139649 RepID=UPI0018CF4911|nr:serine/threonine-protein phosphatase 6 regulatory ankyrin repeat subunit C [Teleopsis dalmanni]